MSLYMSNQAKPRCAEFAKQQVVERVNVLMAMGFPQKICEIALKEAGYNVERAANLLIEYQRKEDLQKIE
jgi:uncharacterized UBP type Zn finger protein